MSNGVAPVCLCSIEAACARAVGVEQQVTLQHTLDVPGHSKDVTHQYRKAIIMAQAQPYSVQLDAETARKLVTHGATILLLDVPLGMPLGVDQQAFLTGPKFKGIKMLPPGVHFLSYQAMGKDGTLAPPVSTLLHLKPQQVVIRRWHPASEGFTPLADEDEEARYAAGVTRFDFDRELAPYDLNRYSQWASLSCHITEQLLQQLLPANGEVSVMAEAADPCLTSPSTAAEKRLQQQLQEGRAMIQAKLQGRAAAMDVDEAGKQQQQQHEEQGKVQQQQQQQVIRGGRCKYSQLPRLIKAPGMTAAQLTALNMDKTNVLEQVITRYSSSSSSSSDASTAQQQQQQQPGNPDGIQLVGELQFAFIAFVFGQSLEGFMQWKQLLVLFLGCVAGPLESHTQLFLAFLAAVTAQLQFGLGTSTVDSSSRTAEAAAAGGVSGSSSAFSLLGVGGLVDELLPDSFLKTSFKEFFEMLQELTTEAPAALLAQARLLESVLASGLGWDFRLSQLRLGSEDEDDEDNDGPVMVELSEEQLAALEAQH